MRGLARFVIIPLAVAVVFLAGCSVNTKFVYKPEAPAAGGPKFPGKVAVLPFKDGTEDFKQRGSIWTSGGHINLAKAGVTGAVTALTPEFFAKSFADELAASGRCGSARFVYGSSELVDEELVVEGAVNKANWGIRFVDGNEFALAFSARRRADNTLLWEKAVARQWNTPDDIYKGCGMSIQCMADRHHAELNKVLQAMFAEAGADLVRTVGSGSPTGADGGGLRAAPAAGDAAGAKPPAAPAPESAEQAIERILKGQ